MSGEVTVALDMRADPHAVYALVSDVTRMGEWSPETTSCRWVDGVGPKVGARFHGTNRHGFRRWSTSCLVTAADPGARFSFDVRFGPFAISTWSYEFETTASGCTVTESWTDRRPTWMRVASPAAMGVMDRDAHNRANMETTLARLKAAVEGTSGRRRRGNRGRDR